MDTRSLARGYALARIGLGATFLLFPRLFGLLTGPVGTQPVARLLLRMLGARDLAVGAGALAAVDDEDRRRAWLRAGGAADAVDLVALLAGMRHLPTRGRLLLAAMTAAGGAATGFLLAERPGD